MQTIRIASTLIAAVVASTGLTSAWATQMPAEPTPCNGTASGVQKGNLVIRSNEACYLENTRIDGNVVVKAGGSLYLSSKSEIRGNVVVEPNAVFASYEATVRGDIMSKDSSVSLWFTKVDGQANLGSSTPANPELFFNTQNTTFTKDVASTNRTVVISDSGFQKLTMNRGSSATVMNSTAKQDFAVRNMSDFVFVCDTRVDGNGAVDHNARVMYGAEGAGDYCKGRNRVGGDLRMTTNTVATMVSTTTVAKSLIGYNNTPAPTINKTVKAGAFVGQFEGIMPAENRAVAEEPTLDTTPMTKVKALRDAAKAKAEAAGPAFGGTK